MPIGVTGNPGRPIDGDWAIYGIIDQLVWRVPGSEDAKGVGLFGRVIGAPSDQNLVDFYAEGGITFSGMIPHRADDSLGIGFAYTGISDRVHGFDIDFRFARGAKLRGSVGDLLHGAAQAGLDAAAGLPILLAARRQCA